ncbi:hypothetical protein JAK62_19715 [Stenotrophomonas maltophilia]|uniref:hypothetical protein n=1 Tax=Stenotrophomonas maltophilia TaxID=40324 RepID=UPI0013DC7CDF|nr:hypothetical protein [Stenotrophomonas maltophilia]MCU1193556.1 hypothetical protein [Stenotrophomonas maltophilia]
MYRLTKNPDEIYNTVTCQTIPRGHRDWPEEWLMNHVPEPAPPPYLLYSPEHFRAIRDQAFAWMRGEAVARGYDGIESCASYYNSSVSRYRLEARAMVAWRDAVNQQLEQLVLAPPAGIETWDQVRALLPQPDAFDWPERAELPLDMGEKAVLT